MKHYRNNTVIINLQNIVDNYNNIKSRIDSSTKLLAVIKANAYGHGLVETALALSKANADGFCVAILDEAIILRDAGIKKDIFVLSNVNKDSIEDAILNDIIIPVSTIEGFNTINNKANMLNHTALIQIAINTGMNRIGFNNKDEIDELITLINSSNNIELKLCFSHLANCDDRPNDQNYINEYTTRQLRLFDYLTQNINCPKSIANSAGIIRLKNKYHYARCGISMYGYPPVYTNIKLKKALEWHTEIINIMCIKKGECVGYGCTYTAETDMKIATIATGYADGYYRAYSNKANVIVADTLAKVIGRVCMDQVMIDITNIDNVKIGDDVVLIGKSKTHEIDAEYLANIAGTISYEILLSPSERVKREYK